MFRARRESVRRLIYETRSNVQTQLVYFQEYKSIRFMPALIFVLVPNFFPSNLTGKFNLTKKKK